MDVVSVTTSPPPSSNTAAPRRLFSFLSVAWGFVSDVDIESERYICSVLYGHESCLKSAFCYTRIAFPFQISRTGLGSFYAGHSGAHSFSPILQRSPVVLASHKLYLIPGCHTTSATEDHLPKYHRRPGGPLPHTHPSHMLRHGHQRTTKPAQGRRRAGKRGAAERKGEKEGEGSRWRSGCGEGKQPGRGQREGAGGGDGSRRGEVWHEFRIKRKG